MTKDQGGGTRPEIRRTSLGLYRDPDGHLTEVEEFELVSPARIAFRISTLGAALVGATVPDRAGRHGEVILGPQTLDEAVSLAPHFLGVTMGRFGRIVSGAAFPLDGCCVQLTANAGPDHLHGGNPGFNRFVWMARTSLRADCAILALRLARPDGDNGYPGAVRCSAVFRLYRDGTLRLDYATRTDKPTLAGLVCHAFWDLSGERKLDGQVLTIASQRSIRSDTSFRPDGGFVPLAGSGADFRAGQVLCGQALDLCFELASGAPLKPACTLAHHPSGRRLQILTEEPCLAVYTGDGLPWPRAGICLQPGPMPDSPNQPAFATSVVRPGKRLRQRIEFRLSTSSDA